jgi:hypothetical protein
VFGETREIRARTHASETYRCSTAAFPRIRESVALAEIEWERAGIASKKMLKAEILHSARVGFESCVLQNASIY